MVPAGQHLESSSTAGSRINNWLKERNKLTTLKPQFDLLAQLRLPQLRDFTDLLL
jgi:hypothetical protein